MTTADQELLSTAYAAAAELAATLNRRQMRQAGLSVLNIRRRARAMAAEGEITADMTPEQIRDTVLDDLYLDSPFAFEDLAAPDWNAIVAFIEKLLPLILKLIALFA